MEIESIPDNPSKKDVTFESAYERHDFGTNAPILSYERLVSIGWDLQGGLFPLSFPHSVAYWQRQHEFPQTIQVPTRVIGVVARKLSQKSAKSQISEGESKILKSL